MRANLKIWKIFNRLIIDIKLMSSLSKGQLISEQIYAILNFPKMQRNIVMISALTSKMGQDKKGKAHNHPN